ncbi:translation initiation factor IF-3, mitochondrial [Toxotes jaculatrix]|uniref:translation initiation factor IF-3, mitochondrial n=1 Tax=Toxotes jaculatrix TaxID=941984 RepID=UPI001B3B10B2|nr:translation initiation factor IF-3, mitochondrial [Toxotes jaculatrix]
MSAGFVRWVLNRAARTASPGYWTPASRFLKCSEKPNIVAAFSTAADDTEQTPATVKEKKGPGAYATINSVGRKISQRHIQVLSNTGEDLGTMHRADVIKLMDAQGLKLVLINGHKEPPVYQLMSGKQIHQEQMKLREKQKSKPATVQVKELTFSASIGSHDLTTKLKQVESWLERKHHVRITLRSGHGDPEVNLETNLEQMVQQMDVMVGFVARPQVIRDGKAAMCIVRPPSAKELSQKSKNNTPASQSANSSSNTTQRDTSPVSSTETTEGPIQQ